MSNIYLSFVLLASVALSACSSVSSSYSKTGDSEYPALDEECPISIYTISPKKEYEELGVIDLDLFHGIIFTEPKAKKASDIKTLVAKDVCAAGGNGILLWEANGSGFYTKTTVIRTK